MRIITLVISVIGLLNSILYGENFSVTTNQDSGVGTLRQAIIDSNKVGDDLNTINIKIPQNIPIKLLSDLPVIQKNTKIISENQQIIDGDKKWRLFATIMSNLSITNCVLQNGAAVGGNGGGGGLGAGGGVYIDRGNQLFLENVVIKNCIAQGGNIATTSANIIGGGGASFSIADKNGTIQRGGGDYPGYINGDGGTYDNSLLTEGYGGGHGGNKGGESGGNGAGTDGLEKGKGGGSGGYCGGGGAAAISNAGGGGGGNPGGKGIINKAGGGGGFGSGGGPSRVGGGGGGGFGGGGGNSLIIAGGGGFGGGCGYGLASMGLPYPQGGFFANSDKSGYGNAGAGIGGGIFVGDSAFCYIKDNTSVQNNSVLGGKSLTTQPAKQGEGYAPDIFLFRKATLIFNNQKSLDAPFLIQADTKAPKEHIDSGIVKQGKGTLTLSNINNNYRGLTHIEDGVLTFSDPKVLNDSIIVLKGGELEPAGILIFSNSIDAQGGAIKTADGIELEVNGKISGSGPLKKTGFGVLKPTNTTNNYTGGTEIKEGKLSIETPEVLGNPNGKIILQTGDLQTTKDLTLENPIEANGGSIDTEKTLTATGRISGSGPLKKIGLGTLSLININNDYSGGTEIKRGNLYVKDSKALGNPSGSIELEKGKIQTDGDIELKHPINIGNGSIETIHGNLIASGKISGNALIKTGLGTLTPTNTDNNYTGETEIKE
ncbi:MAG: autotransporter-associated beta strand repeat-containing protein, partial [Chlamydiales bacterium]